MKLIKLSLLAVVCASLASCNPDAWTAEFKAALKIPQTETTPESEAGISVHYGK